VRIGYIRVLKLLITRICVQNKILLTVNTLTRFNIDLLYRFIYYRLLCTRFFYYASFLLLMKKQSLFKLTRGANFVRRRVYTVLRSPFVHKKSREQFEFRVFKANFFMLTRYNTCFCLNPYSPQWLFFLYRYLKNNYLRIKTFNTYFLPLA
jgi:hypothetical protein